MWWAALMFTAIAVGLAPYAGPGTSVWLGVVAGLVAWWVDIQMHPITRCWLCSGDPKVRDHKGTSWRNCAACGGSGRRRRLLARRER